jgi:hypothetical protein
MISEQEVIECANAIRSMPFLDSSLDVVHEGKVITRLNSMLVKRQKVSPENVELLKHTHVTRYRIFEKMEATDNVAELRQLAKDFEDLEFYQQELWGFPKDKNFHRWFKVPKCLCPKMDNMDRIGSSFGVTVENCPIHGWHG